MLRNFLREGLTIHAEHAHAGDIPFPKKNRVLSLLYLLQFSWSAVAIAVGPQKNCE
jgi:hypothetical protein